METQANQPVVSSAVQQPDKDNIELMDLLLVVVKHNRFIIGLTACAAILAVIYALLQPDIYTGKVVIQPPQKQNSSSIMFGQLGGLAGLAGGVVGAVGNPGDPYVAMLNSRTLADALIQRLKLMELYKAKTMASARSRLAGATVIAAAKDGSISIGVSDNDPEQVAAIANGYVEELNNLVVSLATREASERKAFYEKQLREVSEGLSQAEFEMKRFQEKNRVFRLGNEGIGGGVLVGAGSMALGATGEIPKAELELVRITRSVKYHEMLLAAMAQQVASAKMDAAKESAGILVLDKAIPPEQKSKPERAKSVITTTLVALIAGILLAFLKEAAGRFRQNPEQAERMNLLRRYLRHGC